MGKTVFLGVEGSGKTTLAMAMLRAVDGRKSAGWYMKPLSRDSFRFVETMPRDFLKEGFPSQTSDLRELRWQLEKNGEDFGQLEILDYPGEIYRLAFLDEKDERDKEAFRQKVAASKKDIDVLLDAIKGAERVFVLFSLDDALNIRDNPKNLDAVWITYECLNTLKKLSPQPEIKLVFTQADRYREAGMLKSLDFSCIDLILRNHGDVIGQFLSVLDPPESEFGILKVLPKALISELEYYKEIFGKDVVEELMIIHKDSIEEFVNVLLAKTRAIAEYNETLTSVLTSRHKKADARQKAELELHYLVNAKAMLEYAISHHLDRYDCSELQDKKTIVEVFCSRTTVKDWRDLCAPLKSEIRDWNNLWIPFKKVTWKTCCGKTALLFAKKAFRMHMIQETIARILVLLGWLGIVLLISHFAN